MEIRAKYVFGSENSLDRDVLYIVDELPGSIKECKDFCVKNKGENDNVNLATIRNGVIYECFKGTPDELNNAVRSTYHLHTQSYHLLIEKMVERDVYLKTIRAVRSILSHFSKSPYRKEIKAALKGSWEDRINALTLIGTSSDSSDIYGEIDFDNLNNNMTKEDVFKLVAFQIGQTLSLILNGKELYTKNEIADEYKEFRPYLMRERADWEWLQCYLFNFCADVRYFLKVADSSGNLVTFKDKNGEHTYDLQKEKKIN